MADNVYCLVKITENDEKVIAAVQYEIKLFDFFYQSEQLTDYIYTDYRNALDRLRVCMNIILFTVIFYKVVWRHHLKGVTT